MYLSIALILADLYFAWVAAERYGVGFSVTFIELLSGPLAFNWGQPPAQPDNLLGYLLAALLMILYGLGWARGIPLLSGTAVVLWWLFGFMGTFFYAS